MVVLIIDAVLAVLLSIGTYVGVGFIFHLWANPGFYPFFPLIFIVAILYFIILLSYFPLFIFISSRFISKKKPQVKAHRFAQKLLSILADIFVVWFGIKIVMSKEDKAFIKKYIKEKRTAVFIANHTSNLDMFIFWSKFKRIPVIALCKPEINEIPVVGRYSMCAGNVSINRENPMQAIRGISNAVKMINNNPQVSFTMFPEGTRSKDGTFQDFHAATFIIPEKTHKDLIIFALQNANAIKERKGKITKVYLSIVKVIPADELAGMSSQEMSDKSHELLANYLEEHKDRLYTKE